MEHDTAGEMDAKLPGSCGDWQHAIRQRFRSMAASIASGSAPMARKVSSHRASASQ